MNIEEALEEFNFFNEGDYITREMSIAKDIVLTSYEKLEKENKTLKERMNYFKSTRDCDEEFEL